MLTGHRLLRHEFGTPPSCRDAFRKILEQHHTRVRMVWVQSSEVKGSATICASLEGRSVQGINT